MPLVVAFGHDKYTLLPMDEMYVKEDLVYDKHTGALTGFVNLGQTNHHLLQLEHQLCGGNETNDLAKTMIVQRILRPAGVSVCPVCMHSSIWRYSLPSLVGCHR